MNNYEDEILDELEIAEEIYNIDSAAIKGFERDIRTRKQKLNKKTSKVKIDVEEKE